MVSLLLGAYFWALSVCGHHCVRKDGCQVQSPAARKVPLFGSRWFSYQELLPSTHCFGVLPTLKSEARKAVTRAQQAMQAHLPPLGGLEIQMCSDLHSIVISLHFWNCHGASWFQCGVPQAKLLRFQETFFLVPTTLSLLWGSPFHFLGSSMWC